MAGSRFSRTRGTESYPAAQHEEREGKRELLVSKTWIQAVALVFLIGFFILGLLAYRTYQADPPIPERVVDPQGRTVYTESEVRQGQKVFLGNGLMEYGSIFGHGAYLGPDFTADYLRRSSDSVMRQLGGSESDRARVQTRQDFQANRYDESSKTLRLTKEQAVAHQQLERHYGEFFGSPTTELGLRPEPIKDPDAIHDLTAYFGWAGWATAARRPGHNYSYTNNWPPEPRVGNEPTANVVVWSVVSLIALLGGIGLLFAAFGRWNLLGWHGREGARLTFRSPGDVALTPAQRACAWFFLVMAGLFLVQTLVGSAAQHYRADLEGFFGIDIAQALPFNLVRTWHVQLAIFFVATSFIAAGIFLAPMIAGREPRHQAKLAFGLLAALVIVVVGSMAGELAGIHNWLSDVSIFGNQGFEYLDLGRFWQVLLIIGLFLWVAILYRGLRGRLSRERVGNMPWLFFLAALAIPAFYAVGLLARADSSFTVADFWRFWVVHLWVEDFLELFTTVMVAYLFVLLAHTDFVILGRVVQAITGKPVGRLLRKRVLGPLRLRHTDISALPKIPAPVLHSYTSERGPYEDSTFWSPSWTIAKDMIATGTIADVIKSAKAVGTGALISRRASRERIAPITAGFPGFSRSLYYGLGINVANTWQFQNPQLNGYTAISAYLPSRKISLALAVTRRAAAAATDTNYSEVLFAQIADYLAPNHPVVLPSG